jgi:hypothetical protein
VILVVLPLSAQAIELKAAGVMLGGSWIDQKWEYVPGYDLPNPADDGIPGPVVGAFSSIALGHHFSASLEAMYIQKGFENTSFATDEAGLPLGWQTKVYYAHYLSVPVTIRFELGSNTVTPYCFAGIGAEILLSDGDYGFFDSFNSVNLGGHLGIGLAWRRFGLDIRYLRDLTDATDPVYALESVTNDGVVAALTYAIWE